jgi:hypothetical protein
MRAKKTQRAGGPNSVGTTCDLLAVILHMLLLKKLLSGPHRVGEKGDIRKGKVWGEGVDITGKMPINKPPFCSPNNPPTFS